MKHSWRIIGASLMLAFVTQSALGQGRPQGGGQGRGERPGREDFRPPGGGGDPIARALDADQDGVISAGEIANAAVALKALDVNNDGKLTVDEIRPRGRGFGRGEGPGGPGGPGGGGEGDFVERIMSNDGNGDGKITREELPERMQRMFDRIDADGDGFIVRAEVEQMSQRFGGGGGQRGPGGPGAQRGQRGGDRPDRPQRPQ